MKKHFLEFLLIVFLSFLAFTMFCIKVEAKTGVLSTDNFWINSQTTDPYHITISGNSNTTAYFHYYDVFTTDYYGPYLFFSVASNKKIDIKRTNSAGSSCSQSCFSNDVYLLMTDNTAGAYSYLFYFNARKYKDTIGSQYIEWQIDDNFKFINKESGTADVYIYGVYANDINEVPNYINSANTTTMTIENQNQNTQDIIDNDDNNTQTIIDNDNANTQAIIDSNKVCSDIRLSSEINNSYLGSAGGVISTGATGFSITPYIKLNYSEFKTIKKYNNPNIYTCFYNNKKTLLACYSDAYFTDNALFEYPSGSYYVRISYYNSDTTLPHYQLCTNGNQANSNAINDLNDNITNSGIDSPNSDFSDMEDMIAENGVITNLLSLPITLYSKILNSVNGTCSSYNLGTLFGTNITFSCISLQTLLGNTIWGVIDILFSGFTIYAIAKKMIKVFNNMSSLKEGDVIDD